MVENANRNTAKVRTIEKWGMTLSKDKLVSSTPPTARWPSPTNTLPNWSVTPYVNIPSLLKKIIVSAVNVQITTVSTKGSNSATNPSLAGYWVRTAECAMAAEPIPASFEKLA